MTAHQFIPGLELNRMFYREAVAPILASAFPDLRYSAALIGRGSDVLGYDSERSTDHGWGPRLRLFLSEGDQQSLAASLDKTLAARLPAAFRGYSTGFANPDEHGVRSLETATPGKVRHYIEINTLSEFLRGMLNIDPDRQPSAADWLIMPQQNLLEVTSGEVYHDGLGSLARTRRRLAWYPRDVWLLILAAQWKRIDQEEPFAGRCHEAGDELGLRIVLARLVRDLMRLCLLMERRYAPYSKWLGTAFVRLNCASELGLTLDGMLAAQSWPEGEEPLCAALEAVARIHNALAITEPLDTKVRRFHDRPYRVIGAARFAESIVATIRDEEVRQIHARAGLIGAIDQFADSTDLLGHLELGSRLRALFE
ncbi:MAG TPA: DUF4037 domain-containing protein [Candidatus Binataceae bacterium]|nr:DUF4037 domain-containing protein [Candidatus Binataceae bacterium]